MKPKGMIDFRRAIQFISGRREQPVDTIISRNTSVHGNIKFTGAIVIDGHVTGDISSWQSCASNTLISTPHAKIDGTVNVKHIVATGKIHGALYSVR